MDPEELQKKLKEIMQIFQDKRKQHLQAKDTQKKAEEYSEGLPSPYTFFFYFQKED